MIWWVQKVVPSISILIVINHWFTVSTNGLRFSGRCGGADWHSLRLQHPEYGASRNLWRAAGSGPDFTVEDSTKNHMSWPACYSHFHLTRRFQASPRSLVIRVRRVGWRNFTEKWCYIFIGSIHMYVCIYIYIYVYIIYIHIYIIWYRRICGSWNDCPRGPFDHVWSLRHHLIPSCLLFATLSPLAWCKYYMNQLPQGGPTRFLCPVVGPRYGGLFFFRGGFCFFFGFLVLCFSASLIFCFSAFLLLCFSASLLFCFSSLLFLLLCFSASLFSLFLCFCTSVLFCFSAFLLLCFSASLLFCFSDFLLLCNLLLCFSASLLFCFSAFLLLCFSFSAFPAFPASLLFCFSVFPVSLLFCFSAFPASLLFLLLCFSASLLFCFSAFLLLCFSCFSAFLLLCFPCFSAFVLLCLSTSTILLFLFLQSCVFAALLPAPLLLCFLSLFSPVCILNETLERP